MSDQPDPTPPVPAPAGAPGDASVERLTPAPTAAQPREERAEVTVRRAPRYYRFMLVGLVVGVVVTLALTFSFPEQEDFSQIQVLGFTGIFVVAICVGLGAVVAIVLDRVSRRRARTVEAERTHEPGVSDSTEG